MLTAATKASTLTVIASTAVAAVLLAGCSSSGGSATTGTTPAGSTIPAASGSGPESAPTTASDPTTATVTGGAPSKAQFTYGAKAKEIAAAIGCAKPAPIPSDSSDMDLGVTPVEDDHCFRDGKTIEITTWKSKADETKGFTAAAALITSFGFDAYIAEGDGWFVALDADSTNPDDDSNVPTSEQQSLSKTIVKLIGGKVVHIGKSS